jgi:hypothetical protein
MENSDDNAANPSRQRHGCVTAWLIFMLIINSLVAVMYLFASNSIASHSPVPLSGTTVILLGVLSVVNVVFAVMLLQWKKIAFWGFAGMSVLMLIINLSLGLGIGQSLFGFIGLAILYGVLQIKKNGVTAWQNLK